MIFKFENLGYIDKGTIELGDLTVICGPNNVGKSYISYAIHGWLLESRNFENFAVDDSLVDELRENGHIEINLSSYSKDLHHYLECVSKSFKKSISYFFNSNDEYFKNTNVELLPEGIMFDFSAEITNTIHFGSNNEIKYIKPKGSSCLTIVYSYKNREQELIELLPNFILKPFIQQIIRHCLFGPIFRTSFPITSERNGISIFQKQLDYTMSSVMGSTAANSGDSIKSNAAIFNYTRPITFNIDLIRSFEQISKQKSFISQDEQYKGILDALYDLMKGTCKVINDQLVYICHMDQSREEIVVPIHLASSAIKSLALIELYIRSIATQNDLLIIDEPEQNLYPSNQRKIAGLIAMLVNAGIKVLITTHSDFLVREINNRLMLSQKFSSKERIMREAHIHKREILQASQVKAYAFREDHSLSQAEINQYGINLKSFDQVIVDTSDLNDEIYYSLEEQ